MRMPRVFVAQSPWRSTATSKVRTSMPLSVRALRGHQGDDTACDAVPRLLLFGRVDIAA